MHSDGGRETGEGIKRPEIGPESPACYPPKPPHPYLTLSELGSVYFYFVRNLCIRSEFSG